MTPDRWEAIAAAALPRFTQPMVSAYAPPIWHEDGISWREAGADLDAAIDFATARPVVPVSADELRLAATVTDLLGGCTRDSWTGAGWPLPPGMPPS